MEAIRNLWQDESGVCALEYGLLVALIVSVIIYAVSSLASLGTTISNMSASAINVISTAS